MLKLSLKYKSRAMSPRDISRALKNDLTEAAITVVEKEVQRVRCPVHGGTGRITRKLGGVKSASFSVSGCCQELIDSVKAKLNR